MKKIILSPPVRAIILICAFSAGLLVSSFMGFAVIDSFSIDKFLETSRNLMVVDLALFIIGFIALKLDLTYYSHAGLSEFIRITLLNVILLLVNTVMCLTDFISDVSMSHVVIYWAFYTIVSFCILFSHRFLITAFNFFKSNRSQAKRILIAGAGDAGSALLRDMKNTKDANFYAVGFVDDNPFKINSYYSGVKVYGSTNEIIEIAKKLKADEIVIAMPSADQESIRRVTNLALQTKLKVRIIPAIYELFNDKFSISRLKEVDVCDLLGRDPVNTNLGEVMDYIENKVVMVTGGGGSIGSELCRQIASHSPKQLIILDIYENSTYDIEQKLKRSHPELNLTTLIASVRDLGKMEDVFAKYKPDIVFHAAAHKHVPLMETSPNEAIKNNVFGTLNTAKCADKYGAEIFLLISTDKAVNPTNIMGASKRICEMIVQHFAKTSKTRFVAVRFGNVLGSNGSVIPLFRKQIEEGGPVTVTHKDIVRYFMTIPEAVSLVIQSGAYAKGGEIFVLDMGKQVKIYDLATNLIRLSGFEPEKDIKIVCTGLRPGEKLYEECLMEEEGLQKTANGRIRIGKPINFDDEFLMNTLDRLYDAIYHETHDVKEMVKELVPTYSIYKEENK